MHRATPALALALLLAAHPASAQIQAIEPPDPSGAPQPVARSSGWYVFASARVIVGASVRVSPGSSLGAHGAFTAGLRLGREFSGGRMLVLVPDVGVAWTTGIGGTSDPLMSVGFSPGFSWNLWGIAWAPRALWSPHDDAWGVRNGARLLFLAGLFDVEVAHQMLRAGPATSHEVIFSASLDLGCIAHVLATLGRPHRAARPRP